MNRTVFASVCVASVVLAGCSTSPQVHPQPVTPVSIGPVARLGSEGPYFFGAGDELGRQIFTVYVASLRSDQHFATGAHDAPGE